MKSTCQSNCLQKKERLCGKKGIDRLLAKGRHGNAGQLRYIFARDSGEEFNRIMISVPKKLFKRAVKRNLLKRRIRESWRRLKHELDCKGVDILIIYSTKEIITYREIYTNIETIIGRIKGSKQKSNEKSETEDTSHMA